MNKNDKEVSFREGFWFTLAHWKALVVGLIVGTLLLGAFSYYKSFKSIENPEEQEEMTEEKYQEMLSELTEEDRDYVKRAVAQYNDYRTLLAQYEENYLVKMDTNNVSINVLQYFVKTDYSINYAGVTETDKAPSIVEAYRIYAAGGVVNEFVYNKIGKIVPSEAINYLITSAGPQYSSAYSFTVTVKAADKETCDKMTEAVKETIEEYSKEIKSSIGAHELELLNELYTNGYDSSIYSVKTTMKNNLDSAYSLKGTCEKALVVGTEARDAYDAAVELYDESKVDEEEETSKASISKKHLVAGAAFGVFAVIAFYFFVFVFRKKINNAEEVVKATDSFNFGIIPDKAGKFERKRLRLGKDLTKEAATKYIAESVSIYCKKNNINEVALTGTLFDGAYENELVEALNKEGKEVKFVAYKSILKDVNVLGEVTEASVIVVETVDATDRFELIREAEIMNKNGISVIGNIALF